MPFSPRQQDHRPVFDTATLPWPALSQACAAGDSAVFDALWQGHKRPEQARGVLVRTVFAAACAKGDVATADWVHGLYGLHIDAKTLRQTADIALRTAPETVWNFLCSKIDAHHGAADIYKSLFKTAAEHAPLPRVQKVFAQGAEAASEYLYAAVLGDNTPALGWLMDTARQDGSLRPADLDKALLLATERAQTPMASMLLGAGANAGAFDEAAIKRAAPHSEADNGGLMELLVRAGAHAEKAAALVEIPALAERLIQAGRETQNYHADILARICGTPPLREKLCAYQPQLGHTGLHYAAENRVLHHIPRSILTADDLAQKNADQETVLDVLLRRGAATGFFKPEDWRGQVEKLSAVFDLLPATDLVAHGLAAGDRADKLRQVERLTLADTLPAGGFKLGQRLKP